MYKENRDETTVLRSSKIGRIPSAEEHKAEPEGKLHQGVSLELMQRFCKAGDDMTTRMTRGDINKILSFVMFKACRYVQFTEKKLKQIATQSKWDAVEH